MGSGCFMDREMEKPRLVSAMRRHGDQNANLETSAVIVYSERGIGKTALIQAAAQDAGVDVLSVRISAQAQVSIQPPGAYFESIVHAFRKRYPDCSFETGRQWSPGLSFEASIDLVTQLSSIGFSTSPGWNEKRADEVRREHAASIVTYCNQKHLRPTFHLERCNAMDAESLSLVHYLASHIPGACFIFEYSLIPPVSSAAGAIDLREELSGSVTFHDSIPLEKLSLEDAVRSLPDGCSDGLTSRELGDLYEDSGGDLRLFQELCREATRREGATFTASGEDVSFAMALLELNQGTLQLDTALEMLGTYRTKPIADDALRYALKTLVSKGRVIEIAADTYTLPDIMTEPGVLTGPSAYVAYGVYSNYLQQRMLSCRDNNLTFKLLDAQLKFCDSAAVKTIELVKPSICTSRPTQTYLVRSIEMMRRLVERDGPTSRRVAEMALSLFSVFFAAADYERANEFLEKTGTSDIVPLCRFLIDVADSRPIDIPRRKGDLERMFAASSRTTLLVRLNYMSYLMRSAATKEAREYADGILADEGLRAYPEYWWIMKQRSFCVPPVQRILDLRESSNELRRLGSTRMAARVEITLSSDLARLGRTDESLRLLYEGLDSCESNHCRVNVYLNNIAAVQLMSNDCTAETLRLIRTAETYVATPYEHMLMACNELVSLTILRMWDEAENKATELEHRIGDGYASASYQHTRDTNLAFYYEAVGNNAMRARTLGRLRELGARSGERLARCVEAQIEGRKLDAHRSFSYVTRLGYKPSFIGYWQCELERSHIDEIMSHYRG